MTFAMNEQAVAALVARLQADLPAQVTAINAEAATVADGYTITMPGHIYDYPPQRELLLAGLPAIGIEDGGSRFEDDTGFSVTGVHTFAIVVWVSDADQQALARKLRRYIRAAATAALRDRSLGTGTQGFGVTLKGYTRPGRALGQLDDPDTWLAWTAVVIEVKTDD